MKYIICEVLLFAFFISVKSNLATAPVIDRTEETKWNVILTEIGDPRVGNFKGISVPLVHPEDQKKYNCIIPNENQDDQDNSDADGKEVSVKELMAPLSSACSYRLSGWWTYEFCYGKHLRQFHQEKDMPLRPQDEFYLGRQDGSEEGTQHPEYYSEIYSEGSTCDITGSKRTTEMRFYCSSEANTIITDIKEPFSCQYIVSISTPYLCKHPDYRPKREKTQVIYCSPTEVTGEDVQRKIQRIQENLDEINENLDEEDVVSTPLQTHTIQINAGDSVNEPVDEPVTEVDENGNPINIEILELTEEGMTEFLAQIQQQIALGADPKVLSDLLERKLDQKRIEIASNQRDLKKTQSKPRKPSVTVAMS